MKVAIIKNLTGNVQSVRNALDRLGVDSLVTADPAALQSADRVIFPGVGEASSAMSYLREINLMTTIRSLKQPVLAICLGMQLLCRSSEENDTPCLGILPYRVRRFPGDGLKVPHTGWNNITGLRSPLLAGVADEARVYFVHSYFMEIGEHTIADTTYGTRFAAAAAFDNFYGVQFHPEKSGPVGAQIFENFLNI